MMMMIMFKLGYNMENSEFRGRRASLMWATVGVGRDWREKIEKERQT